ncbi:cleft lip and palate transmembrane protein 1-like protein, partial [Plakobranchus ocellatus]
MYITKNWLAKSLHPIEGAKFAMFVECHLNIRHFTAGTSVINMGIISIILPTFYSKTVWVLNLTLTYSPMSLFKWQLYAAQGMRNKWVNMLGSEGGEDEEDQDSLK